MDGLKHEVAATTEGWSDGHEPTDPKKVAILESYRMAL
jgi:hypothetical protein